ncbi:MAG: OprO/OprP family phosphate-selective porin [Holophagales bacterium]|jgi:hypothetical protein|nr:OprO/OprP family phosphate-selective porin [Holophagales bacterium]
MTNLKNISATALLLTAGLPAVAQAPKISGLAQIWYTQMMDNNLRHNSLSPYNYYNPAPHTENSFYLKRVDVKLAGGFGDVEYEVMMDPTITTTPILQDASVKYKLPYNFEIKVGQFKPLQTLEAVSSSAELMLAERSMLARVFGDPRDRGITASVGFGDPSAFGGRFHVGMFNAASKGNDANAQKDLAARLEMNYGKEHLFGAYTLQGTTNLTDKGSLTGGTFFGTGAPTPAEVLDNKDKTTNLGAFYRFQNDKFHAAVEFITGALGRRWPSLNGTTSREHLEQSFMGYVGTFAYTVNKHKFVLRYDNLNYNSGDKWYGNNPYVNTAAGTDYTPNYTETSVGYIYALAEHYRQSCIRVNYIMRSKNFLAPRAGQTGEQGGDSLVVAFQAAF